MNQLDLHISQYVRFDRREHRSKNTWDQIDTTIEQKLVMKEIM